jgi:rod shape determining protein RodA
MTLAYPTAVTRRRSSSYLRRLDWPLVGAALALSVIGSVLVWSATQGKLAADGGDPQAFFKKHLINLIIGVFLGWLVSRFDYRLLRAYTPILWGLSIVGLLFVLVHGQRVNGAKAWIGLPAGFSIQPAEFAKIAIILGMAMIL